MPGLGLLPSGNNIELNLVVTDDRDRGDLLIWFNELWNDSALVEDVKIKVLAELARLYGNKSPQFIYYLTLYHLFRGFLDGSRDLDESLRRTTGCAARHYHAYRAGKARDGRAAGSCRAGLNRRPTPPAK